MVEIKTGSSYAFHVSIRFKIILVVLPILLASIILVGVSSYFSASAGINKIARDFLGFKVYELEKYAQGQWQLLIDSNLQDKPEMIQATKGGVDIYATSIIRSPTEVIFALDTQGNLQSSSSSIEIPQGEGAALIASLAERPNSLLTPIIAGETRVVKGFYFAPFSWWYVISDLSSSFYSDVEQIGFQTIVILIASLLVSSVLLILFSTSLTRPLRSIVNSMKEIITSGDLSKTVDVEFSDETGTLAHTFNIMTGELDKAWKQIKNYALQAVLAQKREFKIRNIFQKYVPQELINRFEANPESMLVGEERIISILFSDIRSFTTISESMKPSDLVQSLNQYFSVMVDLIMNRSGVVDKYIGDAIMAFFGAPVRHEDDALQSVLAGIEMTESVKIFNADQIRKGKPEFHIGVGINFGNVTVGNIGTDKKMDYTVIGDNVNLASRMEGLTKEYHQELLITESLVDAVKNSLPIRLLDTVAVKGKTKGVRIYTCKRELNKMEKDGWAFHNEAMEHYFAMRFSEALKSFDNAERYLPGDFNVGMIRDECKNLLRNPPPSDWNGVRKMEHK